MYGILCVSPVGFVRCSCFLFSMYSLAFPHLVFHFSWSCFILVCVGRCIFRPGRVCLVIACIPCFSIREVIAGCSGLWYRSFLLSGVFIGTVLLVFFVVFVLRLLYYFSYAVLCKVV